MIKRLAIYLNEMFPLTSFVGTVLTGFAIQLVYIRLFGLSPQFHMQMLWSALVITGVTLLIRVMDEFKDYEDDKRNFPQRPLPSGRVLPNDLKILGWVCVGVVILSSLTSQTLFLFGLLILGYTFLMLKWFFIEERMRQSLPLAFVSHHPIVILNILYLLVSMIETFPSVDWSKACMVLPVCLIFTNWEISRKIRTPEGETAYTTYSKIWGPRTAIVISLLLQATYIATVYYIFAAIGSPIYLRIIFAVVMLIMVAPSIKFLVKLKLNVPLKNVAEGQILIVIATLFVAALI